MGYYNSGASELRGGRFPLVAYAANGETRGSIALHEIPVSGFLKGL
jgi:hypothetical protein